MVKICKIMIPILLLAILIFYPYLGYSPSVDLNKIDVLLSVQPSDNPEEYNLNIRVISKDDTKLSNTNLIVAYLLDSEKYNILPKSDWVYFYNQETGETSEPFYLSGGSKDGAYTVINNKIENVFNNYDSLLITSKIKAAAEPVSDNVYVKIAPYKNEIGNINLSNKRIIIHTDLNDKDNDNELTRCFTLD